MFVYEFYLKVPLSNQINYSVPDEQGLQIKWTNLEMLNTLLGDILKEFICKAAPSA
jgi:hypothetical protein